MSALGAIERRPPGKRSPRHIASIAGHAFARHLLSTRARKERHGAARSSVDPASELLGLHIFSGQRSETWRSPTDHDGAWFTVAHGRDLEDAWSAVRAEGFEDVAGDRLAQLLADGSVVYEVPDADAFSALTDRFIRLNRACGALGMGSQKVIDWSKRGGAHWRPVVTLQATRAARAVDDALDVLSAVTASASQVEMLTAIGTAIDRLKGQDGGRLEGRDT